MPERVRVPLTGRSNLSNPAVGGRNSARESNYIKDQIAARLVASGAAVVNNNNNNINNSVAPSSVRSDLSARSEKVASARISNKNNNNNNNNNNVGNISERSHKSDSNNSLTSADIIRLNNPLEVFRPFSPEIRVSDAHLTRPPVLPKSRYSIVPEHDKTIGVTKWQVLGEKRSVCPPNWVETNMAANWFETVDQNSAIFDIEAKTMLCREFVTRNRNRLWKYDLAYLNRTPRDIADAITNNPCFVKKMADYNNRERALNLSSSDRLKLSLNDDNLQMKFQKADPFIGSLNVSKEDKIYQMTNLLQPALLQHGIKNQRGYKHTVGFGNFSKLNGLLMLNKDCMLNR